MSTLARHRFPNDLRYGDGDHPRQWHLTPPYVLELVRADLGGVIDLDPCTFDDNPMKLLGAERTRTAVSCLTPDPKRKDLT